MRTGLFLRLSRENLDDAADFCIATNDGINLPLPREFDQVLAVLLQGLVFVFGRLVGDGLTAPNRFERGEDVFLFDAVEFEQSLGLVFDFRDGEQQVFGRYELVLHAVGDVGGLVQHLHGLGRNSDLHASSTDLRDAIEFAIDHILKLTEVDANLVE